MQIKIWLHIIKAHFCYKMTEYHNRKFKKWAKKHGVEVAKAKKAAYEIEQKGA